MRTAGPPQGVKPPPGGGEPHAEDDLGNTVRWPAEAAWEAVCPLVPGFTVEVLPQIDSTNSELMRRARAGRLEPTLLVAEQQTTGRGRLGRQWFGASKAASVGATPTSLTFSLGLPLNLADWSGLSLVIGVAVAESLHPHVGLKWPNDLWWQDRKLAGILIETATFGNQRHAVIGIGINIAPPLAHGLRTPPAWLRELIAGATAPDTLLRVAAPLAQSVKAFEAHGFAPFQARFHARDVLRDRAVMLSDGTTGNAHGVDETGALLVHTLHGMQRITSSEISVRPTGRSAT